MEWASPGGKRKGDRLTGATAPSPDHWALALEYEGLARKVALDFRRTFPGLSLDLEDLVQVALLSFAQTARRWDPTKGAGFATFARQSAWSALVGEGKRQAPNYQWDRLLETTHVEHLHALEPEAMEAVGEPAEAAEESFMADLAREDLWRAVDSLENDRERTFIRLFYSDQGLGVREIGTKYGLSGQRVHQIIQRGVARLRTILAEREEVLDGR